MQFPMGFHEWLDNPLYMMNDVIKVFKQVKEEYNEDFKKAQDDYKKQNRMS